ncbi:hypothetical protein QQP08_013096 [Theobroma cacao]|nr:hypothetical protein QQP08_013096 [Theobroma cacao]
MGVPLESDGVLTCSEGMTEKKKSQGSEAKEKPGKNGNTGNPDWDQEGDLKIDGDQETSISGTGIRLCKSYGTLPSDWGR